MYLRQTIGIACLGTRIMYTFGTTCICGTVDHMYCTVYSTKGGYPITVLYNWSVSLFLDNMQIFSSPEPKAHR